MIHFSGENRRIRRAVNTDRLIGLARSHTKRFSIFQSLGGLASDKVKIRRRNRENYRNGWSDKSYT